MEGNQQSVQEKGFDQAMNYCEKQGKKMRTQFRMKAGGFEIDM